jgi:hypothetical protein
MKALLLAGLTFGALSLGAMAPAEAQGGCGPYAHRGWDGYCRPGGGWARPWGYGYRGYGPGWHRHWGGPGWRRPGWGYYRGW